MSKIDVFVSFDTGNDEELYELLLAQSRTPNSGFRVLGGSEHPSATEVWGERVRRRIREVDQVIVICGEHTKAAMGVSAELRIAQEERKPYFLLWGRRDVMCTKPVGAKSSEGMFSWTLQILQGQIAFMLRDARADATAKALRNAAPKRGSAMGPATD